MTFSSLRLIARPLSGRPQVTFSSASSHRHAAPCHTHSHTLYTHHIHSHTTYIHTPHTLTHHVHTHHVHSHTLYTHTTHAHTTYTHTTYTHTQHTHTHHTHHCHIHTHHTHHTQTHTHTHCRFVSLLILLPAVTQHVRARQLDWFFLSWLQVWLAVLLATSLVSCPPGYRSG